MRLKNTQIALPDKCDKCAFPDVPVQSWNCAKFNVVETLLNNYVVFQTFNRLPLLNICINV